MSSWSTLQCSFSDGYGVYFTCQSVPLPRSGEHYGSRVKTGRRVVLASTQQWMGGLLTTSVKPPRYSPAQRWARGRECCWCQRLSGRRAGGGLS